MFINKAFDEVINLYLEGTSKHNFLVEVIKTLELIYNRLDIENPYIAKDETLFDNNLLKFGYSKDKLTQFKMDFLLCYENISNDIKPNEYVVKLEKALIDMYLAKKSKNTIPEDKEKAFLDILYTPLSSDEIKISYNYLHSSDDFEIINYFHTNNKKIYNKTPKVEKELLPPEAYKVVDENYTHVKMLSAEDINLINNKVYEALEVNKNAINFEYMFEKALFNFLNADNKITTGNGFVDILLIISFISTIVMGLTILAMWVI